MGNEEKARSKEHFHVLDGLRGVAALAVLILHAAELVFALDPARPVLPHGQLAVDFFFVLSGFVIAYAYDDRWQSMGIGAFFVSRLVRLHPMVVAGVFVGILCYTVNPFAAHGASPALVAVVALGCLFLLPTPTLPGRFTDTHSLNGPTWSLMQEYLANIAYALVLRKLGARVLFLLMCVSGSGLLLLGLSEGSISRGWGWDNFWQAPVRLAYPFICGLWIYRVRARLTLPPVGFLPLSIVLIALFSVPAIDAFHGVKLNGLFEAGCILFLFPSIVLMGAHSGTGQIMAGTGRFLGRLSYPLYVVHYPFFYLFFDYIAVYKPSFPEKAFIGAGLCLVMSALAVAMLKLWDEPIREWLRKVLRAQPSRTTSDRLDNQA